MAKRKNYTTKAFSRHDILNEIADQSRSNGFDGTSWETTTSECMEDPQWLESRVSTLVSTAIEYGKKLMQSEIRKVLGAKEKDDE